MRLSCVVPGCKSKNTEPVDFDLSFHRFPHGEKNEVQRKAWLKNLGRSDWEPTTYSCLCSKHFTDDCYETSKPTERNLLPTRLNKLAIPTLFYNREIRSPSLRRTWDYGFTTDDDNEMSLLDQPIKEEPLDEVEMEIASTADPIAMVTTVIEEPAEILPKNTQLVRFTTTVGKSVALYKKKKDKFFTDKEGRKFVLVKDNTTDAVCRLLEIKDLVRTPEFDIKAESTRSKMQVSEDEEEDPANPEEILEAGSKRKFESRESDPEFSLSEGEQSDYEGSEPEQSGSDFKLEDESD